MKQKHVVQYTTVNPAYTEGAKTTRVFQLIILVAVLAWIF
jgi:hypothetical protein